MEIPRIHQVALAITFACASASIGSSANAAPVSGRVSLVGTPPKELIIPVSTDCAEARLEPLTTRHYQVSAEAGLANVLVVVRKGLDGRSFPSRGVPAVMECRACQLEPYVVAVQAGQPITFRNDSGFLENLHGAAKKNRSFNFAFPSGTQREHRFDTPEEFIRIKGGVHTWFFAYVCVVEHPFFAVTDREGKFTLPDGLPDGTYEVEAVHLKAGKATKEFVIQKGNAGPLELQLTVPQ